MSQAGKVLSVTNASGAAITSNTHIGNINPIRYRSYYYDAETGFYYLNSRYYDPEVGRFLNADGILGANGGILGYNMFAYCSNNPVMGYDPSGEAASYCTMMADNGETPKWMMNTPMYSWGWTSPVDHEEYRNDAACAAFGYRRGDSKTHKGVDYYPFDGTATYGYNGTPRNVYAMYSGAVQRVSDDFYDGTGALYVLQDDGYLVIYGEIDASTWSAGDRVNQGQLIGKMMPSSKTLMLHLEIYSGGKRVANNLIDPTFT